MGKPMDFGSENKPFTRELIKAFKEHQFLWDTSDENFRKNKALKLEAYETLANVCRKYVPHADADFAKSKIATMRSSFRKEYNKVIQSRSVGEAYIPKLWYYDLLLFLKDEDDNKQIEDSDVSDAVVSI